MRKTMLVVMMLCLILMGSGVKAATITASTTLPTVGLEDAGQLYSPKSDSLNIGGTGQTYTGNNDAATYVANDRLTQGQTFTTGSDPDGYTLSGIYVKHVLYTDSMNNGTWSGLNDNSAITVRVCSVSGTALTVMRSETATVAAGSGIPGGTGSAPYWGGTGKWLYIALATPVTLAPNTRYSFDLTSNGPWFELAGLEAGPYSGGAAYTTATKGALTMGTVHPNGDRTFVVDMTPSTLHYTAPANDIEGAILLPLADQTLTWTVYDTDIAYIDLYIAPENEPNLIQAKYKKLSKEPATTASYALVNLDYNTTYYWRIDAYEPNQVGYIVETGPVWTFKTMGASPILSVVDPAYSAVEGDGTANVSLSVTGSNINSYQWYKIGDPTDTLLTNGAKYSGADTATLTIKGVVQADEGYYYCSVRNTAYPDAVTNKTTGPGRLVTKRLVSSYPLEGINSGNIIPDAVDGFDMTLASADGGTDFASLNTNVADAKVGVYSLFLNNPVLTDPNAADGQYATIETGVVNYDDITIALWAYWNGGSNWQRIFDFGNDTNQYMFLSPNAAGTNLRFAVTTGGTGNEQIVQTSLLPTGQWTHIAITLSGSTGRLYVNGELVNTNTAFTLNPASLGTIANNYIGRSQFADPYFNGMIDDLKIYNYARTTGQIANDYLKIKGGSVCNYELAPIGSDLNKDCLVSLEDLAIFASEWLNTNRISLP